VKHAKDLELLDLLAGKLAADSRESVEAHIASCPECARRREDLRATWRLLGEWKVESPGVDLLPGIRAAIEKSEEGRASTVPRRLNLRVVLRAAAAVLIAVLVGHIAGRSVRPGSGLLPGTPPPLTPEDREEALETALYLDVMMSASPAGLAESLLQEDGDEPEEEML